MKSFIPKKTLFRKKLVCLGGFTLIELLVVISIIGILIGLSLFGLQSSWETSRDAKRKGDLELIRAGLEIFRADCNKYPASLSGSLVGDGSTTSCATGNTYIAQVPTDPQRPTRSYLYSSDGVSYEICASLEQGGTALTCGGSSNCGATCNYKATSP